ncbi:MAG: hypothetical protein K9J47_07510 [Sulfuritalea sp.]|nr:hypothetical protein [Polynucleobacter sp.]MCF8188604.1 hypothetical protein [Sulfuritalea sp.]
MSISSASVEKNPQSLILDTSSVSKRNKRNDSGSDAPVMVQYAPHADVHDDLKINFFAVIPLEVRFQLLHFLVYRRHPVTASDDLFSYAKTCKAGSSDVHAYHEIISDPQQALLASRSLIKCAWAQALTHGHSNRAIMFVQALQKLSSTYTAVYLDVRGDTTWLPYKNYQTRDRLPFSPTVLGPESIAAVMCSEKLSFLHLTCGFPEGEGIVNNSYHRNYAYFDEYMNGCFNALTEGCTKRTNKGIRLPLIFLEVSEMMLQDFVKYFDNPKIKLSISGLYLHGAMEKVFDANFLKESHRLQLEGPTQIDSYVWSQCIEKIGKLKYLHLEGWGGDSMIEGIADWLKDNQSLEKLHLTNCCLGNESIHWLCQAIERHTTLKYLAVDGYHYFDTLGERALASLLKANPDLTLNLGHKISTDNPLESYRLQGRVICDRYPKAMSDFPEIYGELDFFSIPTQ